MNAEANGWRVKGRRRGPREASSTAAMLEHVGPVHLPRTCPFSLATPNQTQCDPPRTQCDTGPNTPRTMGEKRYHELARPPEALLPLHLDPPGSAQSEEGSAEAEEERSDATRRLLAPALAASEESAYQARGCALGDAPSRGQAASAS
eukprot:341191-Rhodomonas_salina.2